MQQIPKHEQGLYGRLTATMGESYVLHTPDARCERRSGEVVYASITPIALARFTCWLPINTQPQAIDELTFAALPGRLLVPTVAVADDVAIDEAAACIHRHRRVVIKAGGGTRAHAASVRALAEAVDGVVVLSPGSLGVLPDGDPRNMHVGGSKGSISGNYAMEQADLLVAIGTRAVCQSDCSGIGYPRVQAVVNLNGDYGDVAHYSTAMLPGDIGCNIARLVKRLQASPPAPADDWTAACADRKRRWAAFKRDRLACPPLHDPVWGRAALTQPVAIDTVLRFARGVGAVALFDAGDVQANGFQLAQDDAPMQTVTETGASYMGFAASAVLAGALADRPRYPIAVTGDGSFLMNPQVLVDGVQHGVRGMIVVLDNRRMAAISGLQEAQYGIAYATAELSGGRLHRHGASGRRSARGRRGRYGRDAPVGACRGTRPSGLVAGPASSLLRRRSSRRVGRLRRLECRQLG